MAGIVNTRNSKIRQGLRVDSPIYYPGHETRMFFRLTNISNSRILLVKGDRYAALFFVGVDGDVEQPYAGVFSDEFDFRGMAEYKDQYKVATQEAEDKTRDINCY